MNKKHPESVSWKIDMDWDINWLYLLDRYLRIQNEPGLKLATVFVRSLSSGLSCICRTDTWEYKLNPYPDWYRLQYLCEPWVLDWVISVGQIPENTDWAVSGLILDTVFVWTLSSGLSCICPLIKLYLDWYGSESSFRRRAFTTETRT